MGDLEDEGVRQLFEHHIRKIVPHAVQVIEEARAASIGHMLSHFIFICALCHFRNPIIQHQPMELFVEGLRRREVQGASEVLLKLRRLHVAVGQTVVQPLLEVGRPLPVTLSHRPQSHTQR